MHMQVIDKKITRIILKLYYITILNLIRKKNHKTLFVNEFNDSKKIRIEEKSKEVCKGGLTADQGLLDFKQWSLPYKTPEGIK